MIGSSSVYKTSSGLVVYKPRSDVSGVLNWTGKIKKPKPRVSRKREDVEKLIAKKRDNLSDGQRERMESFKGRVMIPGWVITETDGHRAVVVRGEGKGNPVMSSFKPVGWVSFDNPALFMALSRLGVWVGDYESCIRWSIEQDQVTLTYQTYDVEGEEVVATTGGQGGPGSSITVGLDVSYTLDALGSWPVIIRFQDAESPLLFEFGDWGYVVMPMKIK